jgi:ABC-2 type transport system permease protein
LSAAAQIAFLGRRAFLRSIRQPGQMAFALVFPLFFLFVVSSGLSPASSLPGFPADSYVDFMFAIPFVHGALFAALNSAIELGRDIDTGFLNRLALTPARGIAIMLGNLAGGVAIVLIQCCIFFAGGLLMGAHFEAGPLGVPVLFLLAALGAVAIGAAGMTVALRSGSPEAVQGIFPLFFVGLFLSSMNMPRNLIENGWFRWIATANPVSYLIEGLRSLVVVGWDVETLAIGFGIVLGAIALALTISARAFKARMTRT